MKTEWEKVTLGELMTFKNGLNFTQDLNGMEYNFLGVGSFKSKNAIRDVSELEKIYLSNSFDTEYLLKKNDLVFVRSNGSKELVGRCVLIENEIKNTTYSGFCIKGSLKSEKTTSKYILKIIEAGFLKERLKHENRGTNISNLNQEILNSLEIKLPSIEEQNKIIEILSTWDSAIQKTEKLISEKEKMFNFILKKIFTKKGTTCYLKKIVNINKGKQLNKEYMISDGTVPVLNGGISYSGFTNFANTKRNTIAISEGGNSCGYVNFVSQDFWAGGHCYTLELKDKEVKTKFLYWMLKSKEKDIMKLRVGSGLPNIQQNDLSNLIIEIYNKNDQVKIIDVLDCQQLEISLLKKQLEQYKLQKQGLMQKLLTGEWRVR